MSSAGNTFLIADRRSKLSNFANQNTVPIPEDLQEVFLLANKSPQERKGFLTKLQSFYKNSKTFDGLVVIQTSHKYSFACDFFNRDGSTAEMCGNAACCMARYGKETGGFSQASFSFPFGKTLLNGECDKNNQYWIQMNTPPPPLFNLPFSFQKKIYKYALICPGVPHGVLKWKPPLQPEKLLPLARELRHKNLKDKNGMNISFYYIEKETHLKALTYERGVENFTQACGTGAIATALAFAKTQQTSFKKVTVQMPGGKLTVKFHPALKLSSPAQWGW